MRSSEWQPKSIAQLVGWALVMLGIALAFGGVVGVGGGASHEPGSATIRVLLLESNVGRFALGLAGVGVLALFASLFMRSAAE